MLLVRCECHANKFTKSSSPYFLNRFTISPYHRERFSAQINVVIDLQKKESQYNNMLLG